jgi:PEP-CTERM motif-containing protein
MKCKLMMVAAAIATLVGAAETAWAFPPSNPYRPGAADIQGMLNRTGDFSGGAQASTATQSNVPGGIQMDVTWSTGAPFVNETFTRQVRSQRFPDDNGDGDGGDLDAFDGVAWNFLSTTAVAVKPYSQDWDNFNFQEGNQADAGCGAGVICVPANTPTVVSIDWDNVGGAFGAAARTNVFEVGFQIFGPGLAQNGSTAQSRITITTLVPEPASMGLVLIGSLALAGIGCRRRGK